MSTGTWPLVGRTDELERITRTLGSSPGGGVVIAGPAGVGKTRLAGECVELAASRGFATARVLASESAATIPLGALSPLLPPLGGDRAPDELLRRARAAIAGRRQNAGLALLVDDAHRLDDMSATLVAQLVAEREAFVIATVRSEESAPDAILALWKDGIAERIDVHPLTASSVEEILRTALDGEVDGGTVRRFTEASGGNPLYLRELVLASQDSGLLRKEDGLWRLTGPLPVSSRLVEIIGSRLAKIDQPERQALEAIAYGEPLGVAMMEARFGADALETLEDLRLITVARDGRRVQVSLAHPLYGEVLRSRLPTMRSREVHRDLAGLLAGTGARRRDDPLRLGTSQLEGGGPVNTAVLLDAAHAARARWDLPLAQRLVEAAAGADAGFPAGLLLAQLQVLQGRAAEAERQLASLVDDVRTDAERVALAATRIDNFAMGLGRRDEALRVATEAEALVTDVDARHELAAKRAEQLYLAGETKAAMEVLEPLLRDGSRSTIALAASAASLCLVFLGRYEEAIEVAERGNAAYRSHKGIQLTFSPHMIEVVRGVALGHAGRLREAQAVASAGHQRAVTEGSPEAHAVFSELGAWASLLAGRPATARRYAAEAAGLYRQLGWAQFHRFALAHLAHATALLGAIAEAETALAELDALDIPTTDAAGALVLGARAWVSVAAGDIDSGRDLLSHAADVAARTHDLAGEVAALHDLARVGRASPGVERLAELATTVEGEFVRACALHAAALAAGDGPALEEASSRFASMGMQLFAAEAAAEAAVALHRAGRARKAADLERKVVAVLRTCEGALTPAVADIDAQARLTPQELKVAGLAAAGMANKDIARQLGVSTRTVETQLQRVYEKLGVHRRTELREALVL